MVFSNTFLFLPPLPALRVKRLSHFLQFTQPAFRQLPVFYGQLYTSFLHFHFRASFLRFATSLNNVRFVASVSLSAGHSPLAANNFCVPFGLLRLRVCHTFCKGQKQQKEMPNPCVNGAAPRTPCFRVTPLASARRLLPLLTPSASFRHASPSVDKFATSAQLPFLAQGCFT